MAGNLQSLNVSVATGMALYEACRQRNAVIADLAFDQMLSTQGYVFLLIDHVYLGWFYLNCPSECALEHQCLGYRGLAVCSGFSAF